MDSEHFSCALHQAEVGQLQTSQTPKFEIRDTVFAGISLIRCDGHMGISCPPALLSMAHPDSTNAVWTQQFRQRGLEALTDVEVLAAVQARGIALFSAKNIDLH